MAYIGQPQTVKIDDTEYKVDDLSQEQQDANEL